MAAAPAAGGAGEAPKRTNIRTLKPSIRIGINKDTPTYVQTLRGIDRNPREAYEYLIKNVTTSIDSNREMCVGLGKGFTKTSAQKSDLLFGVIEDYKPLYGFATVKVHQLFAERNLYFEIDVFCGKSSFKGTGKLIMDEIKKVAHQNSVKSIILKSTPDAIPFYLAQGFRAFDYAFDRDGLTRMYFNLDGSEDTRWKFIRKFEGDPIGRPPTPSALAAAEAPASAAIASATEIADKPPKSAGGARRATKRRSKGSNKKKYTRK